ncbi:MAG: hypothetical protein HEP71_22370 [Roseivirga sp.]|nr:hypothetical protein [Roseivirga sp.]
MLQSFYRWLKVDAPGRKGDRYAPGFLQTFEEMKNHPDTFGTKTRNHDST